MNLTGRPVYKKGQFLKKRGNQPTRQDRTRWAIIASLGCIVGPVRSCAGRITIQHCGTGAGGRKDHAKVIPLCWEHHLGKEGIDGKRMSKRAWQEKYGAEITLLRITEQRLKRLRNV